MQPFLPGFAAGSILELPILPSSELWSHIAVWNGEYTAALYRDQCWINEDSSGILCTNSERMII